MATWGSGHRLATMSKNHNLTNWNRQTARKTKRQEDRWIGRQTDMKTDEQEDRRTGRRINRNTDGQKDGWTGRQTDRKTDGEDCAHLVAQLLIYDMVELN